MIFDTLDHLSRYRCLSREIQIGLDYLANTDFSRTVDGRYELDGEHVYVSISTYDTREKNDRPEAHRAYADIQFLISGEELIGVAPLADMEREVEARPEGDIWFYNGKTENLTLGGRRFAVFFPEDAHAPCIAVGKTIQVRKCVIKVRIS